MFVVGLSVRVQEYERKIEQDGNKIYKTKTKSSKRKTKIQQLETRNKNSNPRRGRNKVIRGDDWCRHHPRGKIQSRKAKRIFARVSSIVRMKHPVPQRVEKGIAAVKFGQPDRVSRGFHSHLALVSEGKRPEKLVEPLHLEQVVLSYITLSDTPPSKALVTHVETSFGHVEPRDISFHIQEEDEPSVENRGPTRQQET
ncbi:amino acid adenylation domain [Striga asiatica]|uniref:Amino acid adenylation domain n=1 Tax=Striga asiatica TaxID=4170 RepID=A0A5A7PYE7_STRAF|nr:amino acid adenylation domain [Striga asiatica]